MPTQTTNKNLFFPDGCLVAAKLTPLGPWIDLGATNSTANATLEYTVNQVTLANAGKSDPQIREMTVKGGVTLVHWDPSNIEALGGGMFEKVETAGTPLATIPDQDIDSGWNDNIQYELVMETSSTDNTKIRPTTKPVITSVTLDPDGTPEVLTEDLEYVITENRNFTSGYGIQFISSAMSTGSPKTFPIRVDFGTNTPIASTALHFGTSTQVLTAYALKFDHTDSNSKHRKLELYSVDTDSGAFQFNFKGANEDGVEELPFTFTAKIDESLVDGRQLGTFTIDAGAA